MRLRSLIVTTGIPYTFVGEFGGQRLRGLILGFISDRSPGSPGLPDFHPDFQIFIRDFQIFIKIGTFSSNQLYFHNK